MWNALILAKEVERNHKEKMVYLSLETNACVLPTNGGGSANMACWIAWNKKKERNDKLGALK